MYKYQYKVDRICSINRLICKYALQMDMVMHLITLNNLSCTLCH